VTLCGLSVGSVKDEVYETCLRTEKEPREIIGHAVLAASGDVFKRFPNCKARVRVVNHFSSSFSGGEIY
jgi:hypothetical protein